MNIAVRYYIDIELYRYSLIIFFIFIKKKKNADQQIPHPSDEIVSTENDLRSNVDAESLKSLFLQAIDRIEHLYKKGHVTKVRFFLFILLLFYFLTKILLIPPSLYHSPPGMQTTKYCKICFKAPSTPNIIFGHFKLIITAI